MASEIYTVGGTVQANEKGLYIPRQADQDLLELCRAGTFAYVLTPRQMGKSSLMMRTAETLFEEGIQAVIVDLTQIGTQLTAEQWYLGLLTTIVDQLMLTVNVYQWWQERDHLGVTQRLTQFFQQVLISKTTDPVVIFIDEIDTTLTLGFADDFYAAIRALYVARSREPELRRLSFVLIGVATPSDLIQDAKRTPFNVGERVDLTDFDSSEALPMAKGLRLSNQQAEQVLHWVLKWTGGHPYLTQRLCKALVDEGQKDWQEADVDLMVHRTFFVEESEQDNNLQFVRDMLTRRAPEGEEAEVLKTYREVWRERKSVKDEEQSLVKSHLKLAGIVRRKGTELKNRNLIYKAVFDGKWIREHSPESLWQRLKPAMPLLGGLSISLIVVTASALNAEFQRINAVKERQKTEDSNLALESEKRITNGQRIAALIESLDSTKDLDKEQVEQPVKMQYVEILRNTLNGLDKRNQFGGHGDAVFSVAFSPDGRTLASASEDGTVKLWNLKVKELAFKVPKEDYTVFSVVFSPDGQTFASASGNGTVTLWDLEDMDEKPESLETHNVQVYSIAFSPDSQTLASASGDKTVKLWNLKSKDKKSKSWEAHEKGVYSVAFSPNGKTLASASKDGTVKLWDLEGNELYSFSGHNNEVKFVVFSPDGQTLASGGGDTTRTVKLWDLGGNELYSFNLDKTVWTMNLDSLRKLGCDWWKDYLTKNPNGQKHKSVCEGVSG